MQLEEFNLNRACIHEAGHTVVALHFGFEVLAIQVVDRKPEVKVSVDQMSPQERFIFLAAGAAGECSRFKNYDQQGAAKDQQEIEKYRGSSITNYLADALEIVSANEDRLNNFFKRLVWNWQCCSSGEAFESGTESYLLLSKSDIDIIWKS